MYDECDAEGKRKHTVAQIAAEFGGTRPTVYRHLSKPAAGSTPTSLLAAHVDHGACPAAPANEAVPHSSDGGGLRISQRFADPTFRPRGSPMPVDVHRVHHRGPHHYLLLADDP